MHALNGRRCHGVYKGEGAWQVAPDARTDEELLTRVQHRDSVAFEALLTRYRGLLHRHVARTVRDEGLAQDVVQDVFLLVWTKAESWDGRGSCRAWLYRIATNQALNQLRTVSRRREQPLDLQSATRGDDDELCVPGWLVDAVTCGPQEALELAEDRRLLRELIGRLPESKRAVVRLVHVEDLEPRAVASLLGVPEGTIRSRLHYARKTLAQLWRERSAATD